MKVCLFTVGVLPVPPVKGGAVENLIKDENELNYNAEFSVTSIFDSEAVKESKKYKHTNFFFVKTPLFVQIIDKLIFSLSKIFIKKKSQSFKMIFTRLHYIKLKFYLRIRFFTLFPINLLAGLRWRA